MNTGLARAGARLGGAWMLFLLFGCGGGSGTKANCTPGVQQACACPGGGQGVQVCADDGERFGACTTCSSTVSTGMGGSIAGQASGGTPAGGASGTAGAPGGGDTGPHDSGGSGGAVGAGSGGLAAGGSGAGTGGLGGHDTGAAGAPASGSGGVGGGAGGPGTGGAATPLVTIEVVQCLIGPGKSDGTEWDYDGEIPQTVTTGLATVLGQPGVGPIINFLASSAVTALSKPDPYGWAEIATNGSGFDPANRIVLADTTTNMEDTFQPLWLNVRGWRSVPLSSSTMVRVTLLDEDLVHDDAIGIATIPGTQLQAALAAGGTYWVRVEQMTQNQLLAIGVQVTAQ